MMKHISAILIFIFALSVNSQNNIIDSFSGEAVNLRMNPSIVEKKIDEKIYGVLMEHIYHSMSNGLWGETVWNRSFEELLAHGDWVVDNSGRLQVDALNSNAIFHIAKGNDYEISLDVRRTEGNGRIVVGFRDQYRDLMLTNKIYCLLGDEHNTRHNLECSTGWIWHTPKAHTEIYENKQGSLDNGKWYSLRIRCVGNHVEAWLETEKLFDSTIANIPLNGAVRLGAENCKAEFRNIRIKPLDNVDGHFALNPFRHWTLTGEGSIATSKRRVPNHNMAVHIHSTGKSAGVEQQCNFRTSRNDLLKGSLFLRGNVRNVLVQLLDGNKPIAETMIKGITTEWQEYNVALPVGNNCPAATLRISIQDKGDIYIDQVSLMHQSAIDNGGYRKDIYKATEDLKPTIIRWPGGSFVELYDFENSIGKQKDRKGILRWDDFDPLSFGTDEFIAYCRKVGAEPQIVLPIGYHNYDGYAPDRNGKTDWLKKALDWVEYCNGDVRTEWGAKRAENGHPEPYNVKYWEIDNEVWKMDPKLYSHIVRIYSMTLKRRYPSIKIIACGSGRLGKEGIGLDSTLIALSAEYIDYISPHHYMELNKYGNDGVEEYEKYLNKLNKWISASKNPDLKIYVSEWNLDGIDMRTGLFAGGILNQFERMPNVEMAASALLLRHVSATGWNNAFINFDNNGWFAAPNYIVTKLWREHFAPNLLALRGEQKEMNIVSTKTDDDKTIYVKIVNPSDKDYTLRLNIDNPFKVSSASMEMVAAGSLTAANSMENKENIKVIKKSVVNNTENSITAFIPKWSVAVVTLK